MSRRSLAMALICFLFTSISAQALIMVGRGNDPVRDQDWRKGAVDVANLKSRVGWWEGPPFGGGQWTFLYRGDTEAFNAALEVFARVKAPELELVVREGPAESTFLRDDKDAKSNTRYDWEFMIWNVRSYYHLNTNPRMTFLADSPDFHKPLPPPRVTVFVGGGGLIDWSKVVVSRGIRVIDQRGSAAGVAPGSGAVIAGTVYDMATSKPLPGAKVSIDNWDKTGKYNTVAGAQTDDDGRFSIEKIPPGSYRVIVSAKGYASMNVAYETLKADGYRLLNDIELSPEATISGSVVDGAGKPIAGASVRADSVIGLNGAGYHLASAAESKSDAEGKFEIAGLPLGYARVHCFAKNYHAGLMDLIDVPAKGPLAIRMASTGAIKGTVLGPDGKAPTGQIVVNLVPEGGNKVGSWGGSSYAKPDGTFQFDNVPPGKYTISAKPNPGPEKSANETDITVTAGKTTDVELKL